MSANGGVTLTMRTEALTALYRKLQTAGEVGAMKPVETMVGAGDLLRRTHAAGLLSESQVEVVLGAVPRGPLEAWLAKAPAVALEAALERALSEGGEAALAEDGEEREVWASSAHEALMARDRAESARVAIDRWESLKGEELKGAEELRERLFDLDQRFRKRARFLVGLNRRRRVERDVLDEGTRETAWWFTSRADCDDLLRLLAGTAAATSEQHLAGCSLCRGDLKRSRMVERPPQRHLTSDDLWSMDLGLLPAEERRELKRHADGCKACAQVLYAMEEGEKAIAEVMEKGVPDAPKGAPSKRSGAPSQRARRQVALERREFRLLVVRDRGRVRLVVEPREAKGFAAAKCTVPPQRKALAPKSTRDGLEFDLGTEEDLKGRTAKITLKLTERGDPITADVSL
ncbi:MAG TPA: hypothetical protein VFA20_11125 [Myxococcaceae bacterium]|nr:hypothetical protein [Myxococcaceae bacterium]